MGSEQGEEGEGGGRGMQVRLLLVSTSVGHVESEKGKGELR
jgi:hypothetical protein